jgi:hypothetical protein
MSTTESLDERYLISNFKHLTLNDLNGTNLKNTFFCIDEQFAMPWSNFNRDVKIQLLNDCLQTTPLYLLKVKVKVEEEVEVEVKVEAEVEVEV